MKISFLLFTGLISASIIKLSSENFESSIVPGILVNFCNENNVQCKKLNAELEKLEHPVANISVVTEK